ncbi:MAG: hypothetical protein CV089_14690 [Nitrospira sp. WS110]|nr:hypothetical protein [Nitrospira sp. WS110]
MLRASLDTHQLIADLSHHIDGPTQVSTDAWVSNSLAIVRYFGNRATYAKITKLYASEKPGVDRYALPCVSETQIIVVLGIPDYSMVSTSYVEGQNLTFRMKNDRFHRLTLVLPEKKNMRT